MPLHAAAQRLLLTAWAGALWGVGYLAVPVLFTGLDDRLVAGELAGRMFHLVSAVGLSAGAALLAIRLLVPGARGPRWQLIVLIAMVALVAIGEFALQPQMAALKAAGLPAGGADAAAFARLHGIAAVLYLIESVGAAALVVAGGGGHAARLGRGPGVQGSVMRGFSLRR